MSQIHSEIFSPELLAKIDNLEILARYLVDGFISGKHKSLYHGFGSEFVHYRNYTDGDDINYLDWKAYARLNEYYIKVFREETNMNCYIILDSSASMDYKGLSASVSKSKYASIIAASLAYMANKQGDNVGLYIHTDKLISQITPGHRRDHLKRIYSELYKTKPQGRANHESNFEYLASNISRKGLVIYISDLMDCEETILEKMKLLKAKHHDCIIMQIMDKDELTFPFTGNMRFIDSEEGGEIVTSPEKIRNEYLASLKEYMNKIKKICYTTQIDLVRLNTSTSPEDALVSFLQKRQGLLK
ncbi:MAG: DUF58 domain-containing protein [Verrucomicrobiota bacterium]|nr:DUF58 domain-containing protein [Verrucomicrobiota bacterium]